MVALLSPVVERQADRDALIDEEGSTSWREFNERVNRLANALRGLGLSAGDVVALMCGNRREAFEVTLAAMHSSLVVVPVNWHWVADELAYVVNDSGTKALFVDERYGDVAAQAQRAFGGCPHQIVIGAGGDGAIGLGGFLDYEAFLGSGSPDEPAEQGSGGPMFYTSGTTGFPKGVRGTLTQYGLPPEMFQLVAGVVTGTFGIPADGVTLLEGPMYHSAQWIFSVAPLVCGSTVVMRHKFDPAETLELIDRYRVTNIHLVPTQFIRMLKLPEETKAAFDGSSLVVVAHGAAPCPIEVKRAMLEWWGPVITEYYGGTEGGFLSVITGPEWLERPGSLGRETALTELLIVKDDGTLAGPNEPGQIYFRSKTGSDFEYHNAPEKTAAAHLEPGVGTLGDVGYLDEDGYLYLSDRKIDMIISGGVNIYPAEIEGVLVTHPAVADAAVFGIPNDEMGEEVKAAVELADGYTPSDELAGELIAHVREHLAGYKAPRSIDFVDALPRHPTGKLYKRLLRDPYWEGRDRKI
ncbi:MAG: AMP-binding protein [Acidimicrobiales bacterium]|nr:AMP-binding protein [Acidimicrobiales bacterium]